MSHPHSSEYNSKYMEYSRFKTSMNQTNEADRQQLLQMENELEDLSEPIIQNMPDTHIKRMLQSGMM